MFNQKPIENTMNLPVSTHIDRLADIIFDMKNQTEIIEKDLQVLRGNITQLSFINKESDQELNMFLVDSIADLRTRWASQWELNAELINDHKRKLMKLAQEHQDVQINREQLDQRGVQLEEAVGLR